MGQDTSHPACIPKVVTLSLVVKQKTGADALQPVRHVRHVATQPTERLGGSWNCQILPFVLHSHPSRTTEHPRGFSRVPTSEFGHLLGIHKLAGHPGGSQEEATIWVWSTVWNWKNYRTSGRFLERADIWVWASFWNWRTYGTSEKFYHWCFCHRYRFAYSFFPSFCWTSWIYTQQPVHHCSIGEVPYWHFVIFDW